MFLIIFFNNTGNTEMFQPSAMQKQMPFSHVLPFSQASLSNILYEFHPLFQGMEEMDEACALGIALNLILTQFQFAGLTLLSYQGP